MSRDELIKALKAKGYSHAVTYGGPVPMDEWDPYGMETTNRAFFGEWHYQGEIIEEGGEIAKVRDIPREEWKPVEPPFCLGVWHFVSIF